MSERTNMQTRILSRVTIEDRGHTSPCWISTRALHSGGYTKIGVNGKTMLTHRVAYEEWISDIPVGLQLDHLCRNRACCNPAHLEPVTCRENLLRGETITAHEAAQTHCIKGHPFDPRNTRTTSKGSRACRACDRERARSYRLRRASAAA